MVRYTVTSYKYKSVGLSPCSHQTLTYYFKMYLLPFIFIAKFWNFCAINKYHNIDQLLSLYKEMGPFTAPGGASHHHRMAILENTKTTYIYVCATGIAPHCSIAVVVTT